MTVTILKVKFVSEDILFEYGNLPIEFDICCSSPKSCSPKSKTNSKRKQQVKWSEEDDRILRMYAEKEYSWKEIASNFLNDKFTPQQLHQRWKRVLNDSINREPWSEEEDKAIIEYVKKYGCSWSKLRTLLGTQRTDTMVRQRWLKITNGQGEIGVASKHNQPTSLASLSNGSSSPSSTSNTIPNITQPNIQSIVNNLDQELDVFEFIKKHQLINQPPTIPQVEMQPIKKPVQPISLDSLTCDEELFDQRSVPNEPKSNTPPSMKDFDPAVVLDNSTVSSSLGTLLENKYDLMDFHPSLQSNLEREWLNQIFSDDY